ncbi:uncharacterized protein LOC116416701 [Nasonia vitripennis]|uniref:Uncharacterized protein n=1 Tax=Nasonia vitripennis TaxID=7425 RepID=A0A7M7T885_NASVI|nr:uncharacterized protein LOC116416701 [Nasonia vitripennis]
MSVPVSDNYNRTDNELEYSSDEELLRVLEENDRDPDSINKFINESSFFESVELTVTRSPAELLLMALKYAVSNTLSITGILNLLKMINNICGKNIIPESKYRFDQICNNENTVTLHAVCPTCSQYIGTFEDLNSSVKCQKCDTSIDVSNLSSPCYFAIINPSNTIRDYIEIHENYYDYVVSERVHETNVIKDIYDGWVECYKQFLNKLNYTDRRAYVTAIFNTDGAPVFESSTVSIWPI